MKISRTDHDFAPIPSLRIFANFLRYKLMPFGYIERGPGIVWLVTIWLRHRFGFQIASLKIKHKKQFDRLMFLRQKILSLFH